MIAMFWSPDMREKLHALIGDTPMNYKKYVSADLVKASTESQAHKLGKSEVDEDSLVRGYITAIPRHLRDGITEVLTQHNYDLLYFRPVFDEPNFLNHVSDHRPHA